MYVHRLSKKNMHEQNVATDFQSNVRNCIYSSLQSQIVALQRYYYLHGKSGNLLYHMQMQFLNMPHYSVPIKNLSHTKRKIMYLSNWLYFIYLFIISIHLNIIFIYLFSKYRRKKIMTTWIYWTYNCIWNIIIWIQWYAVLI